MSVWFYRNLGLLLHEQVLIKKKKKKDLLLSHVEATVNSRCWCMFVASPAHTLVSQSISAHSGGGGGRASLLSKCRKRTFNLRCLVETVTGKNENSS